MGSYETLLVLVGATLLMFPQGPRPTKKEYLAQGIITIRMTQLLMIYDNNDRNNNTHSNNDDNNTNFQYRNAES